MDGMPPYAEAAERNKLPILDVLRAFFPESGKILEIGSGTGRHAAYFARELPGLFWQASDLPENHRWIRAHLEQAGCRNAGDPLELDVGIPGHWRQAAFQENGYDGVFSANTAHIMPWDRVADMFAGVSGILGPSRKFLIYGPFNREGEYTSPGNASFDRYLRSQNPQMGIRDDREILRLAESCRLDFEASVEMPANNRTLVFRKCPAGEI